MGPRWGGEGAKYWLGVLTEIKNRGAEDVCIAVCDRLKGLSEAITTVWETGDCPYVCYPPDPQHLPLRFGQHRDELSRDLRLVYIAATEAAARDRFADFEAKWATKYPAIEGPWRSAWAELASFPDWDAEIRRVIWLDECDRIPQSPLPARGANTGDFPTTPRR